MSYIPSGRAITCVHVVKKPYIVTYDPMRRLRANASMVTGRCIYRPALILVGVSKIMM